MSNFTFNVFEKAKHHCQQDSQNLSLVNTKTHFEPLPKEKIRVKIILSSSHDARALFLSEDLRLGDTCRSSKTSSYFATVYIQRENKNTHFPEPNSSSFPHPNDEIKFKYLRLIFIFWMLSSMRAPHKSSNE